MYGYVLLGKALNLFKILEIFHRDFYLTFSASFKLTRTQVKIKDSCELLPQH